MPNSAFDNVYSFGKVIFKYNRVGIIIYLLLCIGGSMETMIWNLPLRSFLTALDSTGNDSAQIWKIMLWPIANIMLSILLVDTLYRLGGLFRNMIVRPDLEYTVTRKVTALLMNKPQDFFSRRPTSINNRIHYLAEGTYDAMLCIIESLLPAIFGSFIMTIVISCINLKIGAVFALYTCAHLVIAFAFYDKYIRVSQCNAAAHNILSRQTLNMIQNMSQVKAFARESFEKKRINIFQTRRRRTNQIALLFPERMRVIMTINHFIALLVVICMQISLYKQGLFSIPDITFVIGNFFGIMQLLYLGTGDITKIVEDIGRCTEGINFFKRHKNNNEFRSEKRLIKTLKNSSITFSNVNFGYPNANKLLFNKQSVTIKQNEKIGLVGLSGSGKSTFVGLIMGYFMPSSGSVKIGGYDTKKTDMSILRRHITFLSQNSSLFDRTVLSNIKYGKIDATHEEIAKVCNKVNVDDFIFKLEYGYYTQVSDGGSNLSGGQRQRISMARAMLKDAPIIILDEATSAMDNHTQSIIQNGLKELMVNKTSIVIAHKLQTIVNMDRILVFKDGEIIEEGEHKSLLAKKEGYYKYLWNLQKK